MKPMYLLPCSCGQQTPVEASQAGQEIRCQCGAVLEVPTMRGLSELEKADSHSLPPGAGKQAAGRPGSPAEASTTGWGPRQGVLLLGTVIAVVGLCLASWYYVTRPRLMDATAMSPLQTWQLWFDLSRGIEQRPPWEEMYLRGMASYRRWLGVALGIAGIGVVFMAGALFAPRKRKKRR